MKFSLKKGTLSRGGEGGLVRMKKYISNLR